MDYDAYNIIYQYILTIIIVTDIIINYYWIFFDFKFWGKPRYTDM